MQSCVLSGASQFRDFCAVRPHRRLEWVESAAFDLLLLRSLTSTLRIDYRVNQLRSRYGDLTELLGFSSYPY